MGRREIISCDYCYLRWHLDCLDPPMAKPPLRDAYGRPKHNWMCPVHIDHNLMIPGRGGGRLFKLRRPKNPRVVDSCLRRGFKNNGIIEIVNDPSDSEDDGRYEEPNGVVHRVTELSIKLDFIDRSKR